MNEGYGKVLFILGLRDAYGLKIAIWLFAVWNVYFFVALYAGIVWLSLVLLAMSVAITCYASVLLCKHRTDLIFSSKFAKEHGFPSNSLNAKATFYMHITCFLVFFLAPLIATSVANIMPVHAENMPWIYAGYLLGLPGVIGLLHHFVRKFVDRCDTQTMG